MIGFELSEDQKMYQKTARDFARDVMRPVAEHHDHTGEFPWAVLRQAHELGLMNSMIPADYGGIGLGCFEATLLAEEMAWGCSGIGTAMEANQLAISPVIMHGTEEQKHKYLGLLAGPVDSDGNPHMAAYAVTEPGAGSDVQGVKTRAVKDGDHYIINGQKMWITNGGFADVMIVFAKIDEDKNLTAFIVDGDSEGITKNPEEKKMGIKGSSTRQIFFNDVKVPVENLLYEREKGFKIAVNILNIGRIKLGGAVLGAAKGALTGGVKYANERNQFGRPISKYGAIRHKLAQSAIEIYACESATYRATQNIDDAIKALEAGGMEKGEATLKGIADFAPECAMMKVLGSEVLDLVIDEAVQIHGGMGYSAENRVERGYRDARINRIFEGTNEINRMLTVDMILKKAMKGQMDLVTPAMAVAQEIMGIPDFGMPPVDPFEAHLEYVEKFKKAVLLVAGAAVQKLMQSLAKEQEVLMRIADMMIWTYTAESLVLRVQKLAGQRGEDAVAHEMAMMKVYCYEVAERMHSAGKEALLAFAEGDELKGMLMGLKRFTKTEPFNTTAARQAIAQKLIEENEYCW